VYSNISEELSQGVGTKLYKAPELFQNKKRKRENMMYSSVEKVNAHEADVYSFGVICATILSGKQPFEGDDHDLPTRLRSNERPRVPEDCPEALVSLIDECWSLDRTKRPKFKEICSTLENLKSSVLRGNIAPRIQVVKDETTVFKRILNLPHNIMYMVKRFWRTPTLEGSEANDAQHKSQSTTKVSTLTIYGLN
jgi:serine/threonine protein kinase